MSRFRLPRGFCLAVLAISLIFVGVQDPVPSAAAPAPQANAQAIARVMQIQDRNTARLMAVKGVVGTATGLNAAGQPVVKVFLARAGVAGIPAKLEGVPVQVQVTGVFVALPKRPRPPGKGRNKAPEVTILSPADGSTFDSGATITFEGTATDKEDADLSGDDLIWTSSIEDPDVIGEGASFSTTLSDGTHTITASVTDWSGKTGSDSITVTVGEAPPPEPTIVPIGSSTGNEGQCSAGTLGCRAWKFAGDGEAVEYYALSNNHVYALENNAAIGSRIVSPGLYDTNCLFDPDNVMGKLSAFEPINFDGLDNTIDAAIAECLPEFPKRPGKSTPSDGYGTPKCTAVSAFVGQAVQKYGRTTSLTKGKVTGINATVNVGYSSGTARFVDQIIVESRKPFIKAGDSGSLLVTDPDRNPVGLLFAGNVNGKLAVANHIDAVLARFEVTVDGE